MFCFSPFPCHLQLPFSINQLCLNSPIPGCFPAVQGVRSHYCSQQTRVGFPWTIQSELAPLGGKAVLGAWNWELAAICTGFRRVDFFFLTYTLPPCLAVSNHILFGSASGLALDRCSWISVTVEKVQMELMPCIDYTFQNVDEYVLSPNVPR